MLSLIITITTNNIFGVLKKNKKVRKIISSGLLSFRGKRKKSPQALNKIIRLLVGRYKNKIIRLYYSGDKKYLKLIKNITINMKLKLSIIKIITKLAHNGCKPKKLKRL